MLLDGGDNDIMKNLKEKYRQDMLPCHIEDNQVSVIATMSIFTQHMMFGRFRDPECRSSVNKDSHMFEIIRCALMLL